MPVLDDMLLVSGRRPDRRRLAINLSPDPNSPTGLDGSAGASTGLGAGTAFAGLSLISTLFGAFGQQQAGAAQKKLMDYNATVAAYQAQDAVARGAVAATRRQTQTSQTIGSQRAALAAQGVDINSGSAADVQANAAYVGELDAQTIKNNAVREAWGYQVQATDLALRGKYAAITGEAQAAGTLLTGASNLLLAQSGFGRSLTANDPLFTRP